MTFHTPSYVDDQNTEIGRKDGSNYATGHIGQVAIYDSVLTPERITAHYEAMGL
jgi:hypothetical protein